MSLGIPIKVLHEAEGHIITCESSTGEVYRGKLVEAEEHMNLQVMLTLSGQRCSHAQRSKIDKVYRLIRVHFVPILTLGVEF